MTTPKYQIITYNPNEGADEREEYTRKTDAIAAAKRRSYFNAKSYGTDRGVIVYDLKARRIVCIIGEFPERHRPVEGVTA